AQVQRLGVQNFPTLIVYRRGPRGLETAASTNRLSHPGQVVQWLGQVRGPALDAAPVDPAIVPAGPGHAAAPGPADPSEQAPAAPGGGGPAPPPPPQPAAAPPPPAVCAPSPHVGAAPGRDGPAGLPGSVSGAGAGVPPAAGPDDGGAAGAPADHPGAVPSAP